MSESWFNNTCTDVSTNVLFSIFNVRTCPAAPYTLQHLHAFNPNQHCYVKVAGNEEMRKIREMRNMREMKEMREMRNMREMREMMEMRNMREMREIMKNNGK